MRRLTLAQARRIAIFAQGLAGGRSQGRPSSVTMAHLQRLIDRIGLLQIDSVNVLARAHLLPVMARLGPYDPALLDRATRGTSSQPRRLVEYWAHEASMIPPPTYQLLRWRMAEPRAHLPYQRVRRDHGDLLEQVLQILAEHGPQTARQVHEVLGHERGTKMHWGWNWTAAKQALEAHFRIGTVASAHRNTQFERAYDLTERVLPATVLAQQAPDRREAIIELVHIAARAHGVGTVTCLADYFRLPMAETQQALQHLQATGVVQEVQIGDWNTPAYLHQAAHLPRRVAGRALLAPFDPLVFERDRLAALFGMHYRIEIYTPRAKRRYGYYTLPFLLGEQMVARVDLKADRPASQLLVRSAFSEPDAAANPGHISAELAEELEQMARWQGLAQVRTQPDGPGDLMAALAREPKVLAG